MSGPLISFLYKTRIFCVLVLLAQGNNKNLNQPKYFLYALGLFAFGFRLKTVDKFHAFQTPQHQMCYRLFIVTSRATDSHFNIQLYHIYKIRRVVLHASLRRPKISKNDVAQNSEHKQKSQQDDGVRPKGKIRPLRFQDLLVWDVVRFGTDFEFGLLCAPETKRTTLATCQFKYREFLLTRWNFIIIWGI